MMPGQPSYFRRYWILLVLRATCLAGSGTVSSDFFHKLVYYVNALLPSVGLPSETARVMKASYGPFFPEYQWDLDRLVGAKLVEVADMQWISADQRFFGKYRITPRGQTLAEQVSNGTMGLSDIECAISEMVSAFLSTPAALTTLAAKLDANFGQDTIREGEVIDFGEWSSENHSRDAAKFLFHQWLARLALSSKGGVLTQSQTGDTKSKDHPPSEVAPFHVHVAPDVQDGRSFHLYANYLVHRLAQQSKAMVEA
jgi:hypothetical protein